MNSKETPENVQRAAEIMAVVIKRILDGSTSTAQAVADTVRQWPSPTENVSFCLAVRQDDTASAL